MQQGSSVRYSSTRAAVVPRPAVDADCQGRSQGRVREARRKRTVWCNDSGQQHQQTLNREEEEEGKVVLHTTTHPGRYSPKHAVRPIASIAIWALLTTACWCGAGSTPRAVNRYQEQGKLSKPASRHVQAECGKTTIGLRRSVSRNFCANVSCARNICDGE